MNKWRHRCTRYSSHTKCDHHKSEHNDVQENIGHNNRNQIRDFSFRKQSKSHNSDSKSLPQHRLQGHALVHSSLVASKLLLLHRVISHIEDFIFPHHLSHVPYIRVEGVSDLDKGGKVLTTFCRLWPDIRPTVPDIVYWGSELQKKNLKSLSHYWPLMKGKWASATGIAHSHILCVVKSGGQRIDVKTQVFHKSCF